MGHQHRVSYVIPEMELMSKFHTCFQENRQGFYRLSPVGDENTCYLQLQLFSPVWRMWRWWTSVGQNFHRREPWAAVFEQSWKMHIKRDTFSHHVSCVPALKRKKKMLWLMKTKGQSNSVNNLLHSLCRADHRLSSLLPSPLLSAHLFDLYSAFWAEFKHWRPV